MLPLILFMSGSSPSVSFASPLDDGSGTAARLGRGGYSATRAKRFSTIDGPAAVAGHWEGNPASVSSGNSVSLDLNSRIVAAPKHADVVIMNETLGGEATSGSPELWGDTSSLGMRLSGSLDLHSVLAEESSFWETWAPTVGGVFYAPVLKLAGMATHQPYEPRAIFGSRRGEVPHFVVAATVSPLPWLSFGFGARGGISIMTEAEVVLQSNAEKPTWASFGADAKLTLAPILGAELHIEQGMAMGLSYAGEIASGNSMLVRSKARISITDFAFLSSGESSFLFLPQTLRMGATAELISDVHFGAEVAWEQWSAYQTATMSFTQLEESISLSAGPNGHAVTRDRWVPRAFVSFSGLGTSTVSMGYSYMPSILSPDSGARSNELDANRHTLGASWEVPLGKFHFGLGAQAQWIESTTFARGAEDNTQVFGIGSPGLELQGTLWNLATTLGMSF